jgi:hypothetical protein
MTRETGARAAIRALEPLPLVDVTTTAWDVTRRDRIRRDIARRIGKACAHFTEDQFRRLTEEMADRQVRSEHRANQNYWRDLDLPQ